MPKKELPSSESVEQKITQQITVNAGARGVVEIPIPKYRKVFLKGYGYTWFVDNKYTLSTGVVSMPTRSDQEGSPAIPVIFGTPFLCRESGTLQLSIVNNDSANHTYDVVFYLITDALLDIESTGGDLNLTIGGSAGVATQVSLTDSTGTSDVAVETRYDGVKGLAVDTGKGKRTAAHTAVSAGAASTLALAANAARRAALFCNDSDEVIYLNLGGAAAVNTGIRIPVNGEHFMSVEKGNLSVAVVNCVSTSGSKVLTVTEFV